MSDGRAVLNAMEVPEPLRLAVVREFVKQHGEGYYFDWIITANKENIYETVPDN